MRFSSTLDGRTPSSPGRTTTASPTSCSSDRTANIRCTSGRSAQRDHLVELEHPPHGRAPEGVRPAREARVGRRAPLLARRPRVVAIGECGLDFNRDFSPRPAQEHWFEAQRALAGELGLPVFLHERDAHARFLAILREHRARLVGAVVHCFTGTPAELDEYLALDACIGITGWICDERRGLALRHLTAEIPLDRLMLETDAPFLVPRDLSPRPSRNEPAYLPNVLAAIAAERGEPLEMVAAATTATARRFFQLDGGAAGSVTSGH